MHKIYIAGLGPGELQQMPLGVLEALQAFKGSLYVRTSDHPLIEELEAKGLDFKSYDSVYEEFNEDFDQVYPAIVSDLIEKSKEAELLYAVPGHPMVAEKTTQLLLAHPEAQAEVIGGKSFIDDMFLAIQQDPVEGFQLLDALDFNWSTVAPDQHVIFMQVFHPFVASQLKLELARVYPRTHKVALVDQAGTSKEGVVWKKLDDMDDFEGVHNLLSIYIPPLSESDLQYTLPSLQSLIVEEVEAGTDLDGLQHLPYFDEDVEKEEVLAEILWHTLVSIKNGEELGYFNLKDIIEKIMKKMEEGSDET